MKIRNITELQQQIEESSSKCKREFGKLDTLTKRVPDTYGLQAAFVRLYAHYENCIKTMTTAYAAFIGNKFQTHRDALSPQQIALCHSAQISLCWKSEPNPSKRTLFLKNQIKEFPNIRKVNLTKIIDTESNVDSKVLFKILELLDINLEQNSFVKLDEKLLANRNALAHGNDFAVTTNITKDFFDETKESILTLIDNLSSEILKEATIITNKISS